MARMRTDQLPGKQAEAPTQIPPQGWWQVVKRAFAESSADNVPMLAGGVAFFAFLAVFPALIAALTLYGLIADPTQVTQQMESLSGALPVEARTIITDQLHTVAGSAQGALTVGLMVSLLAALWSTSGATGNLMTAVNLAYDEDETRGAIKLRVIALVLTVGAIVFALLALALVAVAPIVLDQLRLGGFGQVVAQVIRWTLLIGVVLVGLAVMYRIAPNRDDARFRWVTPGALFAVFLWTLGSVAFSLYVNFFGSYNKTYGALAGVIVFMLWLYLSSYIVLLGAEINAE
ncbi:MAG: YihY/virulence factor BrkB family protein, partial [Pseudonocardiaceae bacterium]